MKKICLVCMLLLLVACGKKEWPRPIASDEMVRIDHVEANMDQNCLLITAKMGGKLINLEYFMVEVEQDGCPTCPFTPSLVKRFYPFSSEVYQKENSFVFTICEPLAGKFLRIRLKADNTHRMIDPAISEIITIPMK